MRTAINDFDELQKLYSVITDNKQAIIKKVLENRTRYITLVLEDVRQAQNASAAIRSCDCFGIQDIHIIENKYSYDINPKVVRGATKWVDIYKHNSLDNNTKACLTSLKEQDYKIAATSPHKNDYNIQDLPLDQKVAVVMGTEGTGISEEVHAMTDYYTKIPMYGFTESLNLSVSSALCINQLVTRLHQSNYNWQLSEDDKIELQLKWARKIVYGKGIYDSKIDI